MQNLTQTMLIPEDSGHLEHDNMLSATKFWTDSNMAL